MSNISAFDQLEDRKLNGYEANAIYPDEFYCKTCKQSFEDSDQLIDIYYDIADTKHIIYVGMCIKCNK